MPRDAQVTVRYFQAGMWGSGRGLVTGAETAPTQQKCFQTWPLGLLAYLQSWPIVGTLSSFSHWQSHSAEAQQNPDLSYLLYLLSITSWWNHLVRHLSSCQKVRSSMHSYPCRILVGLKTRMVSLFKWWECKLPELPGESSW